MGSKVFILILCLLVSGCGYQTSIPANTVRSAAENAININTASAEELTRIPHIGDKLAAKIIEHRQVNGPFRRVEHLMLIPGISDTRFRKIRPLVRVE